MLRVWIVLTIVLLFSYTVECEQKAPSLPTGPSKWLDQKSVEWSDLKGKVVLLNVWTFACWNSYRSLPWLVSLRAKFPDLQLIGVHSPEFEWAMNRGKLRQTMSRYKVDYPKLLDDDHAYWRALGNSYWPAFYLVDKQGNIRFRYAGETHAGDAQSKSMEAAIRQLTEEPAQRAEANAKK